MAISQKIDVSDPDWVNTQLGGADNAITGKFWNVVSSSSCINNAGQHWGITGAEPISANFLRDTTRTHLKTASMNVILRSGDKVAYCPGTNEAAQCITVSDQIQGSHFWYGWSLYVPSNFLPGTSWGSFWEVLNNEYYWPSYGSGVIFGITDPPNVQFTFHSGRTAAPDANGNSIPFTDSNGVFHNDWESEYNVVEGQIYRYVFDTWYEFVMELLWSGYYGPPHDAGPAGICRLWARPGGSGTWTLAYSNVNGDNALRQKPPHPTLMYNVPVSGSGRLPPPGNGLQANGSACVYGQPCFPWSDFQIGYYRGPYAGTSSFWFENWFRADSFAEAAAQFGSVAPLPQNFIGQTTVEPTRAGFTADYLYLVGGAPNTGFALSDFANFTSVTVYIGANPAFSGSTQIQLVVYKGDGTAGAPGTLVAATSIYTVNAGDPAQWVTLPVTTPTVTAAPGNYWVGIFVGENGAGSPVVAWYITTTTGNYLRSKSFPFASGPPSSLSAITLDPVAAQASIYATYTIVPAPPTPPPPPGNPITFGKTAIGASMAHNLLQRKDGTKFTLSAKSTITKLTAYQRGDTVSLSGSFGTTTVGTLTESPTANFLDVSGPFTSQFAANVTTAQFYCACGAGGSGTLRVVVYNDDGTGKPGTLLGVSNPVTVAAGAATAWRVATFPSTLGLVAGNAYHIGYWYGTGANNLILYEVTSTGKEHFLASTYSGTTNPGAMTGSSASDSLYSIYLPYTITSPPAATVICAIYRADGTSAGPSTRVAVTNSRTVTAGDAAAWLDYTFAAAVDLIAGDYWLVFLPTGADVLSTAYDVGGANQEASNSDAGPTPSSPFGAITFGSNAFSIYASGTVDFARPKKLALLGVG